MAHFGLIGDRSFTLADDWHHETIAALAGDLSIDASVADESTKKRTLDIICLAGDVDVVVPAGTHVEVSGALIAKDTVLPGHERGGTRIRVRFLRVAGDVAIIER